MFDISNTGLKKGSLNGEVAVITGSTSNVGKGFAQAIAWAGGKVVIVGRGAERGTKTAEEINADCGEGTAIFVQADVSEAADVARLKEEACAKFGKVDILINNAMDMSLNGSILESSVEDLDRAYSISARAFMHTVHAFVPDMISRGHGTVTYSTTQFHFVPGMLGGSVYTAAKAAATSAAMSLSNEVRGTGVNVFCFCPAGVGAVNPASQKVLTEEMKNMKMPGFPGMVPADASGAAMVWMLLHADKMHGTGVMVSDVLKAMDYPFPCPETLIDHPRFYIEEMPLTLAFCYMIHGPEID
ncbi:MAG: SDR family oxidoreductase [Parasporobacterium sp.]|nr:SDR family oxidoreductase [Parasporobacterium sp.]